MSLAPGTVIFANQQRSAWFFTDLTGASVTPPANASPLGYSAEDFGMDVLSGGVLAVGFEDNGDYGDDGPGKIAIFDLNDLTTPLAVTAYSSITKLYDFNLGVTTAWNGTHLYGISIKSIGIGTYEHHLRKLDPTDLSVLQSWDLSSWLGSALFGNAVSMAVSPDGNTLYLGGRDFTGAGLTDSDIARYDLAGNAPLSSWSAGGTIAGGSDEGHCLLIRSNGDLLVVTDIITQYASDGSTVQTMLDPAGTNAVKFGLTPGPTSATILADGTVSGTVHKFQLRMTDGAIVGGFDFVDEDFPGQFAVVPGAILSESPCALHHH